jgi:shikimate dehydrogenase
VNREKIYSLKDLETIEFGGTSLAVVGHPIKHSISPAMHNAALAQLSETDERFKDWAYYRFDIHPEQLAEALSLFHKCKFRGLNLTIPHKVQVLDLIKEISPEAQSMGAVNTLLWNEAGYSGLNTDGYGLERALELDLEVSFAGATVMLLGSGGAARAAAVQAISSGCKQLYIGNRSTDRLKGLVNALSPISGEIDMQVFALGELPHDLPESGVVINATALGLKSDDPAPIDIAQLPAEWKVYDMIYNPSKTSLLNQAEAQGLKVANGLSMLVHQGARALEAWTHKTVNADIMMAAARDTLKLF